MADKIKDIVIKGAQSLSPIPSKDDVRKVKKILRKTDKFLQDKFPNATKKLIAFDDKVQEKLNKFDEKADAFMEKNFPKTKKFIEKNTPKSFKVPKRTSNSTGGRAMLRGGGICKKGMNRKAVGKNS